jgi:transposase
MRNERKRYTEDFKQEAVRLMESSGKPISEIARDLGINDNNLYRWRGQYGRQEVGKATVSNGNMGEMEAELKRLRREVEVLRQERDVLKKAMHIISRSQT